MASIRTKTKRDGTIAYHVLWREAGTGKQTSMTFYDYPVAGNFKRMLEANGHQLAPAAEMMRAVEKRSPLVSAILAKHIDGLTVVTARTRGDYRRDARNHIEPYIGHVPVSSLTKERLRQWLGELMATDISDKTIANVHGLLSSALTTAAEDGHVAGNVCKGMSLPRRSDHESAEMVFLTPDEWKVLDGELGKGHYAYHQLMLRTLAGTGMRWGEIAALQVGDLNLRIDPPSITIVRALKMDDEGHRYIGVTKTRRAKRTIAITTDLADQLKQRVAGRARTDLVFTSAEGHWIHASNVRERAWRPAILRAQNPAEPPKGHGDRAISVTPRIHDLRHSHASWLIAAGVDLLTVQRRLGHESIKTTADRYSHLMPGQQRAAADAIAAVMS